MNILLTGASGFVGKAFIESLSSDDHVVCLGRSGNGENFFKTDITDKASVQSAASNITEDFDALVHLAAFVPKVAADDQLEPANATNVFGLINVLEAFNGRIKKVILGSTAEVYDQTRVHGTITEDSPVNPGSYYGATKLASEPIALTYGKKQAIPALVLRFSVMYGPHDPIARALPNFIRSALKDEDIVISGGQILRDYVHTADVVRAIHCALNSDASGVVNIGTGVGVSIQQAAEAVVAAAGSHSKVIVEPGSGGADIVLSPQKAEQLINYKARVFFPEKLGEMIDSYR
jgi:UDP-glucose 4-epimerase